MYEINKMLANNFECVKEILSGETGEKDMELELNMNLMRFFLSTRAVWEKEKMTQATGFKFDDLLFIQDFSPGFREMRLATVRMDVLLNKYNSTKILKAIKKYVDPALHKELKTLSLMGGSVRDEIINKMDLNSLSADDFLFYPTNASNSEQIRLEYKINNNIEIWESFLNLESVELKGL